MSPFDKPLPKEWTLPYSLIPYYFKKHLAKKMLNKYGYVGIAYLDKNGRVYKKDTFHGVILSVEINGIQIWENGTGKIKSIPPDLRAWKRAKKGTYKDRNSGELINGVDYISSWYVNQKRQISPILANEKIMHGSSRAYNVYGFGSRLVGKANKREDGSFTSTKWITLFFFPILPLGTYRISSKHHTITFGFGLSGTHKSDPLFLDIRQVMLTYVLWLPLLAFFIWIIVH